MDSGRRRISGNDGVNPSMTADRIEWNDGVLHIPSVTDWVEVVGIGGADGADEGRPIQEPREG